MEYRILIVDDEEPARLLLEKYVEKLPDLKLVATLPSAIEANAMLAKEKVDILLLDIRMELLTGLDLLRSLSDPPATILTTAYSEYALESYELDVADYLVKPITFDRFFRAINKAKVVCNVSKTDATNPEASPQQDFIFIKSDNRVTKVALEDVLYLESYGEYVKVHTRNKMLLSSQTMTHFTENLPAQRFYRIHRTYLINLQEVEEMEGNLVIVAGHRLVVSKRQKEGFLQALQQLGRFF
ncbi:MAG: LytTR family DNA-binding domain-containing protein [Bacteroidota bacterium]